MRIPLLIAGLVAAGAMIGAGCGSGDSAPTTQAASTQAVDSCRDSVNKVYTAAGSGTDADAQALTAVAVDVAFQVCGTRDRLDAAISGWLNDAKAEGRDVNPATTQFIDDERELMCGALLDKKPAEFCD